MKFSELIKAFYEASIDVNSVSDLAECTGVAKSFIDRLFAGKNTTEKIDVVFDYLTDDLEVSDLIAAVELIRTVRENDERRRINENTVGFSLSELEGMTIDEKMKFFNDKMAEAERLGQ